jgi:lysophospholipase L1-like esterase
MKEQPNPITHSKNAETPASWRVGVTIAALVPLLVFGLLEIGCRVFNLDANTAAKKAAPQALDMPTWMLREDNTRARLNFQKVDKDALEWMGMFEEGEGFRVRLAPSTERSVVNTFSRIPTDRSRRYTIRSNSLGFRGPEISPSKSPNTFRILVFGDSSAFGWGVDKESMFSEQLREKLQALTGEKKRIEVGNFAIPGDSSEYGKLIFNTFAPHYSPDLVILGFGANDAKSVITPHREQVEAFARSNKLFALRTLLNESALVRSLARLLQKNPEGPSTAENLPPLQRAVPRKRFSSNLVSMGHAAQEKSGAKTLILTLCAPMKYRSAAQKTAIRNGMLFADGQKRLLEGIPALKAGLLYPDEVAEMRREYGSTLAQNDLYYVSSDACHPNAIGHSIVAEQLVTAIVEANLL